jgi:hypothetical protein
VFFIVLDLRLTKVGARRCSFFYAHTPGGLPNIILLVIRALRLYNPP